MPYGWRIVKKRFEATAFDGEGARLYGGRWNTVGNRMVYTASSRSLAALEIVVHTCNTDLLKHYVILSIEFPDKFITTIKQSDLPSNWRVSPAPSELQEIGDDWLNKLKSAILAVPSVIIPEEKNYLLNPAHRDFPSLRMTKPIKFEFDGRLAGR